MLSDDVRTILDKAVNCDELSVDTEGYTEDQNQNLNESLTVGVSVAGPGFSAYFPFRHSVGDNYSWEVFQAVKKIIETRPRLVFHNAKHDIIALDKLDIKTGYFYDTMLMAHWIDENIPSKKLDYLSPYFGGEHKLKSDTMDKLIKHFGWKYVPAGLMAPYAEQDARITFELFHKLYSDFKEQGFDGELWDIEQKWSRVIGQMELQGVKIDRELCQREYDYGNMRMEEIKKELGFNPSASNDLGKFILDSLQLPVVKRTKKNKPSFNKEALEIYDEMLSRNNDPRAKLIIEFRGWQKTCSTNYEAYLNKVSSDGRLRCNYKLHGTKTSRLSSINPNLQNIPKTSSHKWDGRLKKAFIGEKGYRLWDSDYSQLEFRLSAAYAKEKELIEIFADDNRDVFDEMSKQLGMDRQDTKTLVYTLQYGGGPQRIKNAFGVSIDTAKAIRERHSESYPNLRRIAYKAARKCLEQGYLTMWSGRRRHFADPQNEAHKAFNSIIQGGAAEIVKRGIINLHEAGLNNSECRILLQVHDDVICEIEEGKEHIYLPEIKRILEDVKPRFGVKFKVQSKEWGQ